MAQYYEQVPPQCEVCGKRATLRLQSECGGDYCSLECMEVDEIVEWDEWLTENLDGEV
jgi:hypothetical protein